MNNLLDLDLSSIKEWMIENGESAFRGKQVYDWLYKGISDFSEMKNIPAALQNKLNDHFYIDLPIVVQEYNSKDSETTKFLFKYRDGNIIEAVLMKYKDWSTLCVSTQVGCRMGCTFCASTVEGLVRNLSAGEMLGEILVAQKRGKVGSRISNIVLMGSGEPLDNYHQVMKFIRLIHAEEGLNIGQRNITLSTCGIVPKIIELAGRNLQITLAISLHAVNDEMRKKTMPVANKYSISEILDACRYYIQKTGRRITFEYALIKGINDAPEHARELIQLLRGLLCHVNLIPVNPVVENGYEKASGKEVQTFSNILAASGIENTIRREMGSDINAACGQLRRSYLKNSDLEGGTKNGRGSI
jgi:23S rRNA (adenine2503-C2)-methyltransferase